MCVCVNNYIHTRRTRGLVSRVDALVSVGTRLLPLFAVGAGDPEVEGLHSGWDCVSFAELDHEPGQPVVCASIEARQWALAKFDVSSEIASFEVTCQAHAGELFLACHHPPSYKLNRYKGGNGQRYRNAGMGEGAEAGAGCGRAGRQRGPQYVARRYACVLAHAYVQTYMCACNEAAVCGAQGVSDDALRPCLYRAGVCVAVGA